MKKHFISISIVLLLFCAIAKASEWYEGVTFVNSDPFRFDAQRAVLFPHSGLMLAGQLTTGKMYATLPSALVKQLQDAPSHMKIVDEHVLSAREAASYKSIFRDASSGSEVPWVIGAIGAIPAEIFSAVGITSTILDGLMRASKKNQTISAAGLEQLMAEDGRFQLALLLTQDPKATAHQYISTAIVYEVKVGNEMRSYVICSSTFALRVV